jgi:hypothetical protein
VQQVRECFERKPVAHRSQTGDLAKTNRGQQGTVAKLLAGRKVGQVDLNRRQSDSRDSIPQGDTGVSQPASVDDETLGLPARLLYPIDEGAFLVRLEGLYQQPQLTTSPQQILVYFSQRGVAVDVGLS